VLLLLQLQQWLQSQIFSSSSSVFDCGKESRSLKIGKSVVVLVVVEKKKYFQEQKRSERRREFLFVRGRQKANVALALLHKKRKERSEKNS